MKKIKKKCYLCVDDDCGIQYRVATLEQTAHMDGGFSYDFIPNYSVIDCIPPGVFEGIQGLDLDTRSEIYHREGIPTFIQERVPMENRENLVEMLHAVGLDYWDPLEYLVRTNLKYFGDNVYGEPYEEPVVIVYDNLLKAHKDGYPVMKELISNIALNNTINLSGEVLSPKECLQAYRLIYPLFERTHHRKQMIYQKGLGNSKVRRGRKTKNGDSEKIISTVQLYLSKQLGADEAAASLGISKRTFYRYIKNQG